MREALVAEASTSSQSSPLHPRRSPLSYSLTMSTPVIQVEKQQIPGADVASRPERGVTLRAIILALILAVINDYWLVQLEVVRISYPTYASPFYNCVFSLLVLTAANALVRARWPRVALSRIELITIYAMLSITSAVCSHLMLMPLVSAMGYAHFFKTPENGWDKLFIERLPKWLTVSDMDSLKNLLIEK